MNARYESPLSTRYSSVEMLNLFSADHRYQTWRKLWWALAKAESELGLPISDKQVNELYNHINDIDYDCVNQREKQVKHDVMAHVYTYGKAAPEAAGIIHLGATSCYVTDNGDLITYKEGLLLLKNELLNVISNLYDFSEKYKALPIMGYTHYQNAQPVTAGKRATLWMQDLISDLHEIDYVLDNLCFLGCRGTTGTEASMLDLFDGDTDKIDKLNEMLAEQFGFKKCVSVCGQTYPRKIDTHIMNVLSGIGQSLYKFANDMRLLQHDGLMSEPFSDKQIGSSAMAYKRNPVLCERICSLSRYLMIEALNAPMTASLQWFERTLDDSANRRISLPEAFLCTDSILRLGQKVTKDIRVNEKMIALKMNEYLPFAATENIMMEAVKKGKDRQKVHEIIRMCSMEVIEKNNNGETADLIGLLCRKEDLGLNEEELRNILKPELYIGRSIQQTEMFLNEIKPLLSGISYIDPEIDY